MTDYTLFFLQIEHLKKPILGFVGVFRCNCLDFLETWLTRQTIKIETLTKTLLRGFGETVGLSALPLITEAGGRTLQ